MKKNLLFKLLKYPLLLVIPMLLVWQTAQAQLDVIMQNFNPEFTSIKCANLPTTSPCGNTCFFQYMILATNPPDALYLSLINDPSKYAVINSKLGHIDINFKTSGATFNPFDPEVITCSFIDPVITGISGISNIVGSQAGSPSGPFDLGQSLTKSLDLKVQKDPQYNHVKFLVIKKIQSLTNTVRWTFIMPVLITGGWGEKKGSTTGPLIPTMVVHDPPGDASYAEVSTSSNVCHGYGIQVAESNTQSYSASVKLGVEGSVGLFVETEFSASITAQAGLEMEVSETSDNQYEMCYNVTNTFSTGKEGASDDLFIGSSTIYDYGLYYNLKYNAGACNVEVTKQVGLQPRSLGASFYYPESAIRKTLIPNYKNQQMAAFNAGDFGLANVFQNQVNVLEQVLAKNDAAKNSAQFQKSEAFFGGAGSVENAVAMTTSEINNIETQIYVDMSFAVEANVEVAGSGVSGSVGMKARVGSGSNSSQSNTNTNTIKYVLEDLDEAPDMSPEFGTDEFNIGVYKDPYYGTPIFKFDPSLPNKTSCPYEGGVQMDQPKLEFTNFPNETFHTFDGFQPGTTPAISFKLRNLSTFKRTYRLKLSNESNLSGLIVSVGGTPLNNSDGLDYTIPGSGSLTLLVTIQQNGQNQVFYSNLELMLFPVCPEEQNISSAVTFSVVFAAVPPNDAPCAAVSIPTTDVVQNGFNNTLATATPAEATIAAGTSWVETAVTNSIWFSFIAPSSGKVIVSTCGLADFDTQLALYATTDCNNFSAYTLIADNDDGPGSCATNYDSQMPAEGLVPGQTYYVLGMGTKEKRVFSVSA
jgi:hypothetical protein